jgi:hypothetical protein
MAHATALGTADAGKWVKRREYGLTQPRATINTSRTAVLRPATNGAGRPPSGWDTPGLTPCSANRLSIHLARCVCGSSDLSALNFVACFGAACSVYPLARSFATLGALRVSFFVIWLLYRAEMWFLRVNSRACRQPEQVTSHYSLFRMAFGVHAPASFASGWPRPC